MKIKALQRLIVEEQARIISEGRKVVIIFEGRDMAGKDGMIKRLTEFSHPRHTRVVALPAPNEHEQKSWYFQRYIHHLPAGGEITLFNRSWYNRAGVEPVMGFCTQADTEQFLTDARRFEHLLVDSGFELVKIWLDITKEEQAKRLEARKGDDLRRFKLSDMDLAAQGKWAEYSAARDRMFKVTHSKFAPWTVVLNDDKQKGRKQVLKFLLHRFGAQVDYDEATVFPASVDNLPRLAE